MNKFLLTALSLLTVTSASARHLTPDEALGRLNDAGMRHVPAVAAKSPELVYTASADDIGRVYVFGNAGNSGFMALSADDSAPALLAYSDSGSVDFGNLPDNLRYWLDEYARQIAYAAENGGTGDVAAPVVRESVAPKVSTRWDQTDPYYDQTPRHNSLPTPTGCVATALAQIMNWHKWPLKAHGQKSYKSDYVGTLSIDFERVPLEWDKMLDRYSPSSPAENINAVATLMMAVGYASEMVYHQKSSGATGYNAAKGLFEHFGYSKAMSLERREWYGIEEWENMVYAELVDNGPVYYEGTGNGGGHAFVCDGYDGATGFFHFNWGWSGKGDGYYRLSLLNPDYQGTGGNSLGYNYTQDIIKGLKPAQEGVEEQPVLIFSPGMGVITPYEKQDLGKAITIKGYETSDGFRNYSLVTIKNVEFGARIHNNATGEDTDVVSNNGAHDFDPYTQVNLFGITIPATLAEGEYTITPLWRSNSGAWQQMRFNPSTRNYIPATVKDGVATFGFGIADGRIEVKLTDSPAFFTTSGSFTLKGTVESQGTKDFSGLLCAVFLRMDSKGELDIVDQGEVERLDIKAGDTLEWEYTSKPSNGRLTDGNDFLLAIGNANTGELVSPIYKIAVGNRYGELDMSVYDFRIANSNFLDPTSVSATAKIKIVAGEYDGPLAIGYSVTKDPAEPVKFTTGEQVHVVAGDSDKSITITGTLDGVEMGELYYAHLYYKKNDEWTQLSEYPVFVMVASSYSGVEGVSTEPDTSPVYYDMYGRKIKTPLPGRIYIRVVPGGATSKIVM